MYLTWKKLHDEIYVKHHINGKTLISPFTLDQDKDSEYHFFSILNAVREKVINIFR